MSRIATRNVMCLDNKSIKAKRMTQSSSSAACPAGVLNRITRQPSQDSPGKPRLSSWKAAAAPVDYSQRFTLLQTDDSVIALMALTQC